jgi:uncharacterized C2H2 Zn-finger protein
MPRLRIVKACAFDSDFQCPQCEKLLLVDEWDNENNNPELGVHTLVCPHCNKVFKLNVDIEYQLLL